MDWPALTKASSTVMLFNAGLFSGIYVILEGMGDGTADVLWSEMRLHCGKPLLPFQSWERKQVTRKVKPKQHPDMEQMAVAPKVTEKPGPKWVQPPQCFSHLTTSHRTWTLLQLQ